MPLRVKSIDTATKKFTARASIAGPDYAAGVAASGTAQHDHAVAAKDSWAAGVQAAIAANRYATGLGKNPGKYMAKATSVGAQRYGPGVSAAAPFYTAGFGPYLDALANSTPPPRFPRGDPRNTDRVTYVDQLLHKKRVGG